MKRKNNQFRFGKIHPVLLRHVKPDIRLTAIHNKFY